MFHIFICVTFLLNKSQQTNKKVRNQSCVWSSDTQTPSHWRLKQGHALRWRWMKMMLGLKVKREWKASAGELRWRNRAERSSTKRMEADSELRPSAELVCLVSCGCCSAALVHLYEWIKWRCCFSSGDSWSHSLCSEILFVASSSLTKLILSD